MTFCLDLDSQIFSSDVVQRLQELGQHVSDIRQEGHGPLLTAAEVLTEALEVKLLLQGEQSFLESFPTVFSTIQGIAQVVKVRQASFDNIPNM